MVMDATQNQQPSPQSVGREFVRQYYTLLNKAPNHLHRFYNTTSSFIHGESTLVVGQKNIHNRIQQLNFHDCHAKISQVDAQATLGNGVVVQVTGELSNDGQPMRRFTQTFVLGAQAPKKYYVHNDIFRYQDMYPEEENDGDSRSENGDENDQSLPGPVANEQPPQVVGGLIPDQQPSVPNQAVVTSAGLIPVIQQSGAPQQQTIYYSMPSAGGRPMPVLAPPQAAGVPLGAQFGTAGATSIPQQQVAATPTVSQLNGVVGHEDLLTTMPQPSAGQQLLTAQTGSPLMQTTSVAVAAAPVLNSQTSGGVAAVPVANTVVPQNTTGIITGFPQNPVMQQQMMQPSLSNNQPNLMHSQGPPVLTGNIDGDESVSLSSATDITSRTSPASLVPRQPTPTPIVEDFKTINEQQQQAKYEAAKQQQHQQTEPKTYANLFKSTSSSPSGFVNAAMQQQQQLQQQHTSSNFQPTTISTSTFTQSNATPSMSSYNNNRNNESSTLRLDNNSGPLPQRNNSRMNKGDFDQRRSSNSQFGDSQQLFLGNIPHHASEDELKTLFARFGTILELRIHSKTSGKIQPGVRNPPNYGFITYNDPEAVQNCLSHCPLYFPENTPDALKLNVEEKRARRPNDMPRQSMGNNVNNNVNNPQRNNISGGGGPPSRSLSNSGGGMMRGPRIGGAFNRNESRSNGGGGSTQVRGNNNSQSGGGNYGSRR